MAAADWRVIHGSEARICTTPGKAEAAGTRFEEWRAVRKKRSIPESLWNLAEELAKEFGVYRTSRVLRLNYESLKTRVGPVSRQPGWRGAPTPESKPTFVEFVPGVADGGAANEGTAELETGDGARLRVSWRGTAPDLGELSRSFFHGGSS